MPPAANLRLALGFLALATALCLLIGGGAFAPLDRAWLDQASNRLLPAADRETEAEIAVVLIDDASLERFAVPVATLHRQLGAFFAALATAKPRGVAVDMVLPARSYDVLQPGLDAALARGMVALRSVAPLVIGIGAAADGSPRPLHPLFARLSGTDGQGSVFVRKDPDGVVRRFDERLGIAGETVPSLSGQLARRLGVSPGAGLIPMHEGARFKPLPLSTVLDWYAGGDLPRLRQAFAGKVVLLGSGLAHDDQHAVAVPLSVSDDFRHGNTTHGVFIHAMQARALLSDRLIHEVSSGQALLVALLLASSWWLRPTRGAWLIIGGLAGGLLLFASWAFGAGLAMPAVSWSAALLVGLGCRTGLAAWQAARERRRLRLAFDGFVSPLVLKEILAGRLNPSLAGERREVCVLFSDIRGFTSLSEHLSPEAVTDLLNRYFERMAGAIHRHGGTLDKFIGDGIMAFFGAPQGHGQLCRDAFATACDMLTELAAFNREQQANGGPQLAIGVGLHFGPAFIGYIGARQRHEYSAIGDTVNAASRLEGLTKELGFPIVMSTAVAERLPAGSGFVALGEHRVKGRAAIPVVGWRPAE